MKPRSRKNKGYRLQLEVCKVLSDITGIPYGKDEEIAPREMGQSGPDIRLVGKARDILKLSIECKNQEKWSMLDYYKQAETEAYPNTIPIVIVKRNRIEPFVFLKLKDFVEFLKLWVKRDRLQEV